MKNLNIISVAVFTLISTGVFAQTNNNRSKKEQMKMEVVKMNTTPVKFINNVTAINRSAKEQMKTGLMKSVSAEQSHAMVFDNSGNCPNKLPSLHLSPKEQLKMDVVKINQCMVAASDTAVVKDGKCVKCGKYASNGKK